MLSPSQSLQYLKESIERASMCTEWIDVYKRQNSHCMGSLGIVGLVAVETPDRYP